MATLSYFRMFLVYLAGPVLHPTSQPLAFSIYLLSLQRMTSFLFYQKGNTLVSQRQPAEKLRCQEQRVSLGAWPLQAFSAGQAANFTQLHRPGRETHRALLIVTLPWELSHFFFFSTEKIPFSQTFLEKQHPSGLGDSSFNKTNFVQIKYPRSLSLNMHAEKKK